MPCKLSVALSVPLIVTGCVPQRSYLFNGPTPSGVKTTGISAIVRADCLTAPVELVDCDFSNGSPKCRAAKIEYRLDCIQIRVSKSETQQASKTEQE